MPPFTPRNDERLIPPAQLREHATVTEDDVTEAGELWEADPPDEGWENLPNADVVEV